MSFFTEMGSYVYYTSMVITFTSKGSDTHKIDYLHSTQPFRSPKEHFGHLRLDPVSKCMYWLLMQVTNKFCHVRLK